MTKLKRRILAITLASILTLGIILSVVWLSQLASPRNQLYGLQAMAQNYDTINLDCTYSDTSKSLAVNQSTTYTNRSTQRLYEVKFHIYANAYQKDATYPAVAKADIARAYPNGFSAGYIKVTTPHTTISGIDNTVLTVPLSEALEPGKSVTLQLEYTVKLANVKHRLGYTDAAVNLGNFYAIPVVYDNGWETYPYSYNGDPFYNELYNFNVTLNAPQDFVVASSGEKVGDHQYRGYMLRDFALVLSRDFQVLTRTVGDTTVNYYYLNDEIPEVSLYTTCNALTYFSHQFYDYPYATLSVVQTDFLHGGMEYGALVYISLDVTDQLQYQTVIVHELAHQWWYGIVGNNQTRTAWLDEGLAEYSTAVFFETHPQYGKTLESTAEENQNAIAMFEKIMDEYQVPYTRQMYKDLVSYKSQSEYTINTYARGMLLFYNITEMVGYQNLNNALAEFAKQNCFAFANKNSLCKILEACLGKNLTNYINNYLAGKQDIVYN